MRFNLDNRVIWSLILSSIFVPAGRLRAERGTWVQMGPGGATVYSLSIDPSDSHTICAGTEHGAVYRSQDAGLSWRKMEHWSRREESNLQPTHYECQFAWLWQLTDSLTLTCKCQRISELRELKTLPSFPLFPEQSFFLPPNSSQGWRGSPPDGTPGDRPA